MQQLLQLVFFEQPRKDLTGRTLSGLFLLGTAAVVLSTSVNIRVIVKRKGVQSAYGSSVSHRSKAVASSSSRAARRACSAAIVALGC